MTSRILLLLLALVVALPVRAGMFDDEEARARIDQLRRELNSRIDKIEAATHGQIDLANQIESLRSEIAKLHGQIEVLTHDIGQLEKRQKDFYVDLDTRMRKLEQGTAPEARTEKPGGSPVVDPQAETRDYESALNLFKSGKYKDAGAAFEAFIGTYPDSAFQSNAHYWLGNSYYQQRDYRRATETFHKVTTTWPSDPKAADAMLGMANCQQDMGDAKNARMTLEALVAKYPSSTAAQIARQRLASAKKKG
jgi:tol-pal system protein YbgF